MAKIVLREGQHIDQALRLFRRICKKQGILEDYRGSLRFEKKSDKLRKIKRERDKKNKKTIMAAAALESGSRVRRKVVKTRGGRRR